MSMTQIRFASASLPMPDSEPERSDTAEKVKAPPTSWTATKYRPHGDDEPFFAPIPKPSGTLQRLSSKALDWLFPARTLSPEEKRVASLLESLLDGLKSGTIKPTDEPIEVGENRLDRTSCAKKLVMHLEGPDNQAYSFELSLRYRTKNYWGRLIDPPLGVMAKLKGRHSKTTLALPSQKANKGYTTGHVKYRNEDQPDHYVNSSHGYLVNKKGLPLFKALKTLLATTQKTRKEADALRQKIKVARDTARRDRELPEFKL